MAANITTLHRVDLQLVVRHLLGDPDSAHDRIGGRHRPMLVLYCAGRIEGEAFAGAIRDPRGAAVVTPFGGTATALAADTWRSIRLRALRATPAAVWHHPFPLETAGDDAAQHDALLQHLRNHAADAGWALDLTPAQHVTSGEAGAPTPRALQPPRDLPAWTSPRWSPDPEEPPRYIRVFPGQVSFQGQTFTITERHTVDLRDGRLIMAFHQAGGDELWLNDHGRIVSGPPRTAGVRGSLP